MTYREGDPVWINIRGTNDEGVQESYEGTGVAWHDEHDGGLLVQIGGSLYSDQFPLDAVWIPSHMIEVAVRPYARPCCQYCKSLRMFVDGMPSGGLRWVCCDCMGGLDT